MIGRSLVGVLAATLALTLQAAPAGAEVSSVDAYGGQAAVLGKRPHHSVQPTSRPTGEQGASRSVAPAVGSKPLTPSGPAATNAAASHGASGSAGKGSSPVATAPAGEAAERALESAESKHGASGLGALTIALLAAGVGALAALAVALRRMSRPPS
jgi:hypothetical protein